MQCGEQSFAVFKALEATCGALGSNRMLHWTLKFSNIFNLATCEGQV